MNNTKLTDDKSVPYTFEPALNIIYIYISTRGPQMWIESPRSFSTLLSKKRNTYETQWKYPNVFMRNKVNRTPHCDNSRHLFPRIDHYEQWYVLTHNEHKCQNESGENQMQRGMSRQCSLFVCARSSHKWSYSTHNGRCTNCALSQNITNDISHS